MKACKLTAVSAAALVLTASVAAACTIPVFRYALERWEADRLLVVVYHRGGLAEKDEVALRELAARSTLAGGPLNIEVVRYDVAAPPDNLPDLKPPEGRELPWVEVRSRLKLPQASIRWEGPAREIFAGASVFASPARREIIRRLLDGDSAVWLVIAPEEKRDQLATDLAVKLAAVRQELVLPAGIGLPGSELYASIPLEIRFSVLPVSHADSHEREFLRQFAAAAKDWRPDEAYVVPIFGRLRALEVIPYGEVDDFTVRDIGEFLCGACSCRVKQANPGFDLLAEIRWNERLFGDSQTPPASDEIQPPLAASTNQATETPQYVAIPRGDLSSPAVAPPAAAEQRDLKKSEAARVPQSPSPLVSSALLVSLCLIVGGAAVMIVRHWQPVPH